MQIESNPQSMQNLIGELNTKKTSTPFYVTQVADKEFNSRMSENELNSNHLFDIHVQRFMDEGYSKDEAKQRTSQYAFMGALDIPGQLSIFNMLFDKNASAETKETLRQTLKESFDNMSTQNITKVHEQVLPTLKMGGLTPVSSQIVMRNPEPRPTVDLTNITQAQLDEIARNAAMGVNIGDGYEPFILGPKRYHFEQPKEAQEPSIEKPNFTSTQDIKKYFNAIITELKTQEKDSKENENNQVQSNNSMDIFEYLVAKLTSVEKQKAQLQEIKEASLSQYTKNNKPNPLS